MTDGDVAALLQVISYVSMILAFGVGIIGGQQR